MRASNMKVIQETGVSIHEDSFLDPVEIDDDAVVIIGDGPVQRENLEIILGNSRAVDASVIQYRLNDSGYLLAIVENRLIGVLKLDQLLGPKDIFLNCQRDVENITERILDFGKSLDVTTDEELRDTGQFVRKVIGTFKSLLGDAFDGPINAISRARSLLMEALRYQQNQKLVWSGPVQTVERKARDKMEKYVLKREMNEKERTETLRKDIHGVDEDVILEALERAKRSGDQEKIVALLEMWERAESGEIEEGDAVEMVPVGKKQKFDMGPGVSVSTLYRYRVTNLAAVKLDYVTDNKKKIQQVVNAEGYNAESMVGGIEVFEKKSTRFRKPD